MAAMYVTMKGHGPKVSLAQPVEVQKMHFPHAANAMEMGWHTMICFVFVEQELQKDRDAAYRDESGDPASSERAPEASQTLERFGAARRCTTEYWSQSQKGTVARSQM